MIKRFLCAGLAFSVAACGDGAVAADWPGETGVRIEPDLVLFDSWGSTLHAGGVLTIHARTADTSVHILDEHRVRVRVATASGDIEDVDLEREVCGNSLCAGFSIVMESGSVEALYPLMAQFPHGGFSEGSLVTKRLPGRITSIASVSQRFGTGYVWRKADMPRFIQILSSYSGVQSVTREGLGCAGPCPPWHSYLAGYRPLDDRAPQANNGWIEAHLGDTITISYTQPSGAVLTHQVVMGSL